MRPVFSSALKRKIRKFRQPEHHVESVSSSAVARIRILGFGTGSEYWDPDLVSLLTTVSGHQNQLFQQVLIFKDHTEFIVRRHPLVSNRSLEMEALRRSQSATGVEIRLIWLTIAGTFILRAALGE